MRYGFTTGSCGAAAAKAAAYILLTGQKKERICIETPKGISYETDVVIKKIAEEQVICGVVKDGGDDPDVTTGVMICAEVTCRRREEKEKLQIEICGGKGVGKVTRPGLDQPVGEAAINHVPREMIEKEVREVCHIADFYGELVVEISAEGGEELAVHTFNPRLGIEGGISILGTSGIVEPMSRQALLDTIRVELHQRRAEGYDYVAVAPGNYGQDFMRRHYGYDLDRSIKCSNFIGAAIDMAVEEGFERLLLTGHIGKLIKVAGGIMNTHSKEGDCRMELLASFCISCGGERQEALELLSCLTTEEAVAILQTYGNCEKVMAYAMERICFYLDKRGEGKIKIDCIMYANETGVLAKSKEAEEWFTLLEQEQVHRI